MKINENHICLTKIQETSQTKPLESIQTLQKSTSTADRVTLSHASNSLQTAKTAVENSPEIRSELVERLRQEISTGSYHIDPEKIAEKMVDI